MSVPGFVRLPLLFLSGIFAPLAEMTKWGRALEPLSPLTYAQDLIRTSTGYTAYHRAWLSFPVLLLFGAVFFAVVAWIFNASRRRS